MSNLLEKVLLFIVILVGEVYLFVFRLIKVPINFHVVFKLLLVLNVDRVALILERSKVFQR